MVFESVVSNLLNTYLNEFIDDLSANQLKIGAFSGNVELNNLAIKGNAFTSLNLPFRVVTGHIGKLTAVVPWVSLYTSPVVFNIQQVFILCVPNVDAKYDEDLEKEQVEADKKKQLQLVEEAMKSAYLKDRGIESQASYDFVTKLVAQIIKNLEIRIENIHICYEDKFTNPKRPFSIELSLEELKFVTIDDANQTNAQSYKENYFEKDVNLQSFSFYWNCSKDLELMSELSEDDLQATFFERITSHIYEPVINSVNGRGKFKRIVPDDPVKKQGDSFLLDFELEKFPVKLTQTQYKLMLEWSHFVDRTRKMWRNRKWRPTDSIKENPRSWWHYAINANLERFRKACKARTKEFQVERVKDIVDYYRAYYVYLTEPESMTEEMDEIKARIEEKMTFDELYCLREAVYDNIKKNREDVSMTNETNGSWGNWLTSWYFQSPETEKDIEGIVSPEPGQETEMENIAFNFHVPELTLELVTDFENHAQQSLARILMEDFLLFYKKDRDEEKESEAQITLASLVVEDLLVPLSSNHRYLMSSKICDLKSRTRAKSSPRKCDFLSSSCPSSPREYKLPTLSSCVSLPSKLQSANIYHLIPYSTQRRSKIHSHSSLTRRVGCFHDEEHNLPGTPPPSPSNESANHNVHPNVISPDLGINEDQTLVKISIIFVDENSPLFETKYNRNHRLTTVRFNSLETTINPETWAKFLNFFDHQPEKRSKYEDLSYLNSLSEAKKEEQASSLNMSLSKPPSQINIDSKVDLTVRRLSIILNKPEDKPLAKANILGFSCLYSKSNNDISMEGKLKKLSITDLTMYNKIYKERFVTAGDEALHFHYFRYGHEDENLRREYDMKLELQMTSVQYVHTHRFYSEIMEFHKQFTALQARIKALSSPESLIQRASRIKVQIKAAAPVIVIPVHYLCEKVLVADFGQLNATNKFLFAGSPGTIGSVCKRSGLSQSDLIAASVRATYGVVTRVSSQSLVSRYVRLLEPKPCLLDVINVQLTEMDLYAGVVTIKDSTPNGVLQCPTTMLDFPSFCVKRLPGQILKEKFIFHLQIERNLEAEFNHSLPDVSMLGKVSAVHCTLDSPLFQLVRGILDNNLSEQLDIVPTASQPSEAEGEGLNVLLPNRIWTSMALHLDLKDVSLEVIDISSNNMLRDKVLARIDFLSSRLSIESYTDSSKDVDLVSQEIRITDARFQNHPTNNRPNVFPDILKPAKKVVSSSPLQLEIHYRSKRDQVCLTILLNNMRVMAIFDWFRELSDFLSQPISFNKNQTESPENERQSTHDVPFISETQPDFELKFNITDSELVVVENSAVADSNAVILKGTAILNLATDITHPEPFNCTLQGMEVFSCILGVEDQTALSIVDPLNITIDLAPKKITHPALQEASQEEVILVFDISEISLHLSFQDIFLFLKILNSLPTQTRMLSKSPDSPRTSIDSMDSLGGSVFALPQHINQLHLLGFHRSDCVQALEACKGNINEATVWLSRNASQLASRPELNKQVNRFSKFSFQMICLQIHSCVFCLIDDCKDTDVPLFEVRFKDIDLWQRFAPRIAGAAKFEIAADHYNRSLSGWQPVLERWPCESDWQMEAEQDKKSKISFSIASSDRLSLVITNSYLQQYRAVIQSWVDEYERLTKQAEKQVVRRRSPFIPFAIKNETGCDIRFYKVMPHLGSQYGGLGLNSSLQANFSTLTHSNIEWIHARPNEIIPLSFEERGKSRAQDSHRLQSHEIVVQVEGWQPVCPVSIDKVGKYFREASPDDSKLETARIVFDIVLESNARKLITLRSALSLSNATNTPMEVKFGSTGNDYLYILPGMLLPVPLNLVRSKIYARPCDIGVNMCETPIIWEHVRRSSDSTSELLSCNPSTITGNQHSSYTDSSRYYFVSVVLRENFPNENKHRSAMRSMRALPAHQIIFLPTVQVINLLPFEMKFHLKNGSENTIKPGETSFLKYVDTSKECSIYFSMDNYPRSNPLTLTPGSTTDFNLRLELFDKKDRPLYLLALVSLSQNSTFALSITIVAPYWFVNRTGLPIIVKQESAEKEASGQFEEHEIARSISPLLFSFYENEFPLTCVMRLGKTYGRARYCNSFYLHKGTIVRKLRISSNDTRRPDKVYEVGIEIRNGKGRYRDSTIITLSPRYQIENSSSHNLEISQKFAIHSRENSKESLVSVPSKSNVAFHWPRSDQDRLLCIRSMSIKDCNWSGGFAVHINSSFHINLRDSQGRSHFLRLEILAQGATTFIIFSDPGNLPPPIRVDNFSEVPIEFYQTNSMHTWMKTTLKPKSSIPYSWDEPTFKPHLTVSAPGGCSATYDLNQLRSGENLSYENFFYIAFSGTFLGDQNSSKNLSIDKVLDRNLMQMELVLDVPEGTRKVIINRKEPGRRSQLWRMDRYRRLLHEGSSPPRDPRKNSIVKGNSIEFALDIESQFPLPNEYSNLCIRPADNKRGLTQYWNFTKDGRLCCEHPNLFVQPKDGYIGLKIGNGLVLGPSHPASRGKMTNSIPLEQALSTHKMRKGSGILSVRVCSDGPTRVLQIMDIRNIPPVGDRSPPPEMRSKTIASNQQVQMIESGKVEFNLLFKPSNVEFSLVNEFNEEIITIHLFEVVLEYLYKISEHRLNCSVRYIQGDNQLMDAEKPVIFHTMELDESNPNAGLPALNIFVHKLVLPQVEAHFFEDVQITFKDILLNLEEYLVLKVYEFLGYPESDSDLEPIDEDGSSAHRAITSALAKSPRLYFSNLQLKLDNVRLSVFTSPHLPTKLSQIKKKIRLRLVRFEDAKIDLSPFKRNYSLETFAFLVEAVVNHYRQLLKSQAAKILGSVDFLGNPLGFMNDVTDGLSELINEGSVGGLILNLAHGISDSTAKLTSALSDGLGVVAMDDRHQEIRKRIKTESGDHLKAGIKGLGVGILGGFTSIITQTYEGAVNEGGVQGFFSGFGKGLLGTITKPAVGMLDFASSAAIAVRDTSRKMVKDSWSQVNRIRPPRPRFSDYGPGSLLPHYSQEQAIAQEFFYKSPIINDRDDEEIFISFQLMRPDAAVFTTSHKVHFLTWSVNNPNDRGKGQISINLQHLIRCDMHSQSANDNDQSSSQLMYHIIPFVSDESYLQSYGAYQRIADLGGKKPKIRCQSENAAKETMRYINLAKASFQQKNYTITQ